jgi:hypothetical protein
MMMKKTITLFFATFLALGMSAQFSVGVDYMMLSGTMIEDTEGNATTYGGELNDSAETKASSIVLTLKYSKELNEKMMGSVSVGYGMEFGLIPMKLGVSYAITPKLTADLGMGLYMIQDAGNGYAPEASAEGDVGAEGEALDWTGSRNEFGGSLGLSYIMNNISLGIGYDMIKGGDYNTLNAITIGASYSFGGGAKEEEVKK